MTDWETPVICKSYDYVTDHASVSQDDAGGARYLLQIGGMVGDVGQTHARFGEIGDAVRVV